MKNVAFGFLGTRLDAVGGFGHKRRGNWRPTVALAEDPALPLSRLELWYDKRFEKLAKLIQSDIESVSGGPQVVLRLTEIRDPWNFEEVYAFLFDFAADYPFRPEKEQYFVHLTTGTHVAQICLFLLTETRHFPARIVQTSPRSDSGQPSLSIVDLDLSRYDKLAQRFEKKRQGDLDILKAGISTRNQAYNALISEIEEVARASREPLLLLGPTGAGKSHLAKQIYQMKVAQHRLQGQFVDLNCATIRGEQAMSTLFGHAKGAFTGALNARDGLLKKADRGLLFLDELGELGLDEQAMLLRAIEEKQFFPLGSDKEVKSDFQLIAGSNRDLQRRVLEGKFREDLLRRINTWSFTLPALSERREDIEPNIEFELRRFEERSGRRITLSKEARESYLRFALSEEALWEGNFRDLNASVIRMATLAPEGRITVGCVEKEAERLKKSWFQGQTHITPERRPNESGESGEAAYLEMAGILPERIDLFERPQLAMVVKTLSQSQSIAEAGRLLFSISREKRGHNNDSDRLRKYLARFGVDAKGLLQKP